MRLELSIALTLLTTPSVAEVTHRYDDARRTHQARGSVAHYHGHRKHSHGLPKTGHKHQHNQDSTVPLPKTGLTLAAKDSIAHYHSGRKHTHVLPKTGHKHDKSHGRKVATKRRIFHYHGERKHAHVLPKKEHQHKVSRENDKQYKPSSLYDNYSNPKSPTTEALKPARTAKRPVSHYHDSRKHTHVIPIVGHKHGTNSKKSELWLVPASTMELITAVLAFFTAIICLINRLR